MPSLNDPLKTPFVSVFSRSGQQLANSFGDGDITVTSFKYKYDDEDDDICTIRMQMTEPKALDLLQIKRGTELRIKWGYLNGIMSPEATVVVRDMVSNYGPNIISTELQCTDFLTFIKIFKSDLVESISIIDYLHGMLYKKHHIKIIDRGKTIWWQYSRQGKESQDKQKIIKEIENYSARVAQFTITPQDIPSGQFSEEYTDDHPLREFLENPITITSSNRSTYMVIQDLLKKAPLGPWYVTGRGNWLTIHNRHLGISSSKAYAYKEEPGQLLSFQPKTKYEAFEKQSIAYSGMDADDRKHYFLEDYHKALENQRSLVEILKDTEISELEKKAEVKSFIELYSGGYATYQIGNTPYGVFNQGTARASWVPGVFPTRYNSITGIPIAKVPIGGFPLTLAQLENQDITREAPGVNQAVSGQSLGFEQSVLVSNWYTMPLLSFEDAVNVANNRQRELAMEKEDGKIIVEGDPYLQDQQKVEITKVHSQHNGFYYIKKCEHTITSSGYKTQLDCLKVVPEAVLSSIGTITQEKYEAGQLTTLQKRYYKREQALFGADVLIQISSTVSPLPLQSGGTLGTSVTTTDLTPGTSMRWSDVLDPKKKYTDDQAAEALVKFISGRDFTITSIPINPGSH